MTEVTRKPGGISYNPELKVKTPVCTLLLVTLASLSSATAGGQDSSRALFSRSQLVAVVSQSDLASKTTLESTATLPAVSSGAQHIVPGTLPVSQSSSTLPRVFAPTRPRTTYTRFPWKRNIVATLFWVGETPTRNNPTPNTVSAWDRNWTANYGGFDTPKLAGREGYRPKKFVPKQNPFYYALPYNDLHRHGTKASARAVIPWFKKTFYRSGRTVLKGRWMAIRRGEKICYAQWEDVGPFETNDYDYVFGEKRPKTKGNGGAGLDVSPAVKDYLGFSTRAVCDWRFVDVDEVPDGPWKTWGNNNPFANTSSDLSVSDADRFSESIVKVRELRDRLVDSADKSAPPGNSGGESKKAGAKTTDATEGGE